MATATGNLQWGRLARTDDFEDKDHSRYEQVLASSGTYTVWPTAFRPGAGCSYDLSVGCNASTAPDLVVEKPQLNTNTGRVEVWWSRSAGGKQGNGPANATTVEFILAASSTLSANDRVSGSVDVDGQSGGASIEKSLLERQVIPGTSGLAPCGLRCEDLAAQQLDVTGPITVEAVMSPFRSTPGWMVPG